MTKWTFRLLGVIQNFENDTYLAEALFFPEVSRFSSNLEGLRDALKFNAESILESLPLLELYRRRTSGIPALDQVTITIDPPSKSFQWKKPVHLAFHVLKWNQGEKGNLAFVPVLGIEILAETQAELEQQLPDHLRTELFRRKATTSLGKLLWFERCQSVQVEELSYNPNLQTPKHIAADKEDNKKAKKTILDEVGSDLTIEKLSVAYEMEDIVQHLAQSLTSRHPKSVLLVGPSGVGKTAALHELIRRRTSFQLGRTPFWATSGSRLVAGQTGYGMWQERCLQLCREVSKQKAILHLGNLVELMDVGKSESNDQGIASFFRPYLARGEMLAIAECTPEQLPVIEREDPRLLDVFYQIKVDEPSIEKGKAILLLYVAENYTPSPIDTEGIETLDRLHRRYATYSAYPGRPLRFLKNLLQDRNPETVLSASEVTMAFSQETGLPLLLLDDSIPLDFKKTLRWFSERIIGQVESVKLVVELLATVKAGLTRPRKPIASLLFIGPTGVGKTEMAKSLAEFLFQDRNRMIRFDMSEYSDPISVKRLIGGVTKSEGLLTAKVREHPFSVILFDEFEKADPLFFDLLLQVLGEGRLTDAAGRLADFCNSVVIMTSNLGAESFQKGTTGFLNDAADRLQAQKHFTKEVQAFIRPELFNRIDRIVPFAPLDEATVLKIAHRELNQLKSRDGLRFRNVTLQIAEDVPGYLMQKCFDARYGARPLKRAIERELLVPLAEGLNCFSEDVTLVSQVQIEQSKLQVRTQLQVDQSGKQVTVTVSDSPLVQQATVCATLRRKLQKLQRSPALLEIQNEIFTLERLQKHLAKKQWKKAEDLERLQKLPHLKKIMDQEKTLFETVVDLENQILLRFYEKLPFEKDQTVAQLKSLDDEWIRLLYKIYATKFTHPDEVTLAIYSENVGSLYKLTEIYHEALLEAGMKASLWQYTTKLEMPPDDKQGILELLGRTVTRQVVEHPESFLIQKKEGVVGFVLGIQGQLANPKFEPELGLHLLIDKEQTQKCLVHTSEVQPDSYTVPEGLEKRGSIANQDKRRVYNFVDGFLEDSFTKTKYYVSGRRIEAILLQTIEERLRKEVEGMVAT